MLIFGLQQLLPGDPAMMLAGEERDPTVVAYLHAEAPPRRAACPCAISTGSAACCTATWANRVRMQKPVLDLIVEKLPVTLELACLAIVIALAIGIPAGIVSAVAKGHGLGLRRQRVRAVGAVDAQLLARHHADPAVLGDAGLAARVGLT